MSRPPAILITAALAASPAAAGVDELMSTWQAEAGASFDPGAGAALWHTDFDGRSCGSCHGADLTAPGRHEKTGKPIDPVAPSANPERLTEARSVDKWLKRNCQWTLGRDCTALEKGNLVTWLRTQ